MDSDGGALLYTGDTEYSESVVELASTLLIECSFPEGNPAPGHLTPSGAARIASEAGVGRVVLTHIYPAADRPDLAALVSRRCDAEVFVAEDGLRFGV